MPSILHWLETAPRRGEQTMKPGWEARGGDQEWELMPIAKKIHLPATERGSYIAVIHSDNSEGDKHTAQLCGELEKQCVLTTPIRNNRQWSVVSFLEGKSSQMWLHLARMTGWITLLRKYVEEEVKNFKLLCFSGPWKKIRIIKKKKVNK